MLKGGDVGGFLGVWKKGFGAKSSFG